jgi:CHAT domain-containing protein
LFLDAVNSSQVGWLGQEHALTVLPSVSSLTSLRRAQNPSSAKRPMIGFANPLLDGNPKLDEDKQLAERARKHAGCAATPQQRTAALPTVSRSVQPKPQSSRLADPQHLKSQTPLPESADEVCDVARSIGADVSEMRIGAKATETEVKSLSATGRLADYRIVHFATHGTLAGELAGTTEPGLILTPPAVSHAEDDGFLSGSEIGNLKLDADWVILSACNTAGGAEQGQAAEALSGLARMFFYAGARALLVSHWAVDSAAAVKLVSASVGALTADPRIGRAEALRRSMQRLMASATHTADAMPNWHPAVWAPFVVVGEGGAGR